MFTFHESKPNRVNRDEENHLQEYLATIKRFNEFSRKESNIRAMSVKGVYQNYIQECQKGIDWWTTLVRNLDMFDELESVAYKRESSTTWSEIMRRFIEFKIIARHNQDHIESPLPWYLKQSSTSG